MLEPNLVLVLPSVQYILEEWLVCVVFHDGSLNLEEDVGRWVESLGRDLTSLTQVIVWAVPVILEKDGE